jgi:hypothetical protein
VGAGLGVAGGAVVGAMASVVLVTNNTVILNVFLSFFVRLKTFYVHIATVALKEQPSENCITPFQSGKRNPLRSVHFRGWGGGGAWGKMPDSNIVSKDFRC